METSKDDGGANFELQTLMLAASSEAIIVHDLDGNIVAFNEAAYTRRGYTSEEFGQLGLRDLEAPESAEQTAARIEGLVERGTETFETTHRRKDGTTLPVEVRARVFEHAEQQLVLCAIRDITERREAALQYGAILRTAIDGFWVSDRDGRFLDVNDSFCWMVGYTREELVQMFIADIEPAEISGQISRHISHVAEEGYSRFETRHRCKDGQVLDVEVSANFLPVSNGRFFVFVRDITESKRADRAIRRLNKKLQEQVARQKKSIEVLSTSVIHLWDRVVLLPLVGVVDAQRAHQFTESLLNAIADQRAEVAIVDVAGVSSVDAQVALHLIETVTAAKLLGAKVLVTGITPTLARTLVDLDVDISSLDTQASLQAGIIRALDLVGQRVVDT